MKNQNPNLNLTAAPETSPPTESAAGLSAHLLISTNYELPDEHPDKYGAVFITAEEMADMEAMGSADGFVTYSHVSESRLFSATMTPGQARPFFLERSTRRVPAESCDKALILAAQIGIAATGPLIIH